ncbi:MAG: glycosyltransferase family 2 protein [Candidatus Nanoarchaeia archaeon]|nr:glycosyltransferase family 2 protein [Candidatus Nanoarchaeia archaeon]MDD5740542.1 glycosyltransferase family 2 protein [Candidatus Nanoarchaeia archaeon]
MKKPLVHIIILNWNGKEDTIECINSVKKIDYPNYKIILVDNGSTDNSVKVFKKKYPSIKIIKNKENLGYAEGNNVGIRYALKNKADYVLILNNDTVVDKHFLTELVKVAESDDEIGIVGPKVYNYGTNKIQFLGIKNLFWNLVLYRKVVGRNKEDKGQFDYFTDVDFVAGCSTLIKSKVMRKVGLFDKELFLYCEDVDFFIRAKKKGYQLKVAPDSHIWHKGSATSKKVSGFVRYYIARNNFIFVKRYFNLIQNSLFIAKYIFIKTPIISAYLLIKEKDFKAFKDYLRGIFAGINYLFTGKIREY